MNPTRHVFPSGLGPLQRRMWVQEQLSGPSGLNHVVVAFELVGDVDRPALTSALAGLADLAGLAGLDGISDAPSPADAPRPVPVDVFDLRNTDQDPDQAWESIRDRTAWTPFDLAASPLMRASVATISPERTRLVLALHHLITDGFSLELLIEEISVRYAKHAAAAAPAVEDPVFRAPILIAPREAHDPSAALDFWTSRLEKTPTTLSLPPVAARNADSSRAGAGRAFRLDRETTRRLNDLARREGTTPFAILLAAYQVLLARWTRQYEFVIGTPISVRGPEDADRMGLFVETLPLPAAVDRGQPFRELLGTVRRTCAEASAWPYVPIEDLLDILSVTRDPDRPSLIQTLFSYQGSPAPVPALDGIDVRSLDVPRRWAKFDLTLEARATPDGLDLLLEHATAAVDPATAAALAEAYVALLTDALADPGRSVGSLSMTPPEHTDRIGAWNSTSHHLPDVSLAELVGRQTAATPEAVAIVDGDRELTYAEFDARSAALAARLLESDLKPGALVAVCMPRSAELVIALAAVLRAGAAYVPLDPDYPPARLEYMLADSGAALMLTAEGIKPLSKGGASSERPARLPIADAAYVIYTSGSTGNPKGAVNTHRAIVNRLLWMRDAFAVTPTDAVLQKTSASFDVSVWEFFLPLISGSRLVLAAPGGERDPAYLARLIERESVTMVHFVPSMFAAFLDEPEIARCHSLRAIVCSGEALTADLVTRSRARLGSAELHNLYGPTEAAIDVTAWNCAHNAADRSLVPIGRPVWNTRLHVLDEDAQPLPIGFPGELYLGGIQVGAGYLDRPELTAERFPADVFGDGSEPRLYRTGDLVRWTPDGVLDYLGRIDGQIKVRGFRIEPGEVEARLVEHPGVSAAAVTARDGRLVAYVVTSHDRPPSASELMEHAAATLPAQCVPSVVAFLPHLPLTPNGKLDRAALPDPVAPAATSSTAPEPVLTESEAMVASVWAAVLGYTAIGADDDFFALGGDSIRSLKVIGTLRELGFELSAREFFAAPTVAGQARLLKRREPASADSAPTSVAFALVTPQDRALIPADVEDAYPLSALQAGMLYQSERTPGGAVYHDVLSLRARMPWDAERFAETVLSAARNHPALRTSFDFGTYSEPLQLVHRDARIPLEILDWQHLSEAEQDERLNHWLRTERANRVDPTHAPLIRIFIHRRAAGLIQLTISFHHAILDGWSLATLASGLLSYHVPAAASRFADHIALERQALQSSDPDAPDVWTAYLADADLSPLPRWDPPRRRPRHDRLTRVSLPLEAELDAGLHRLAREAGVPVKSVLVEAHATVLGLLTGRDDVTTGLVLHGRPETADADRLLGLFLTPVPLRRQLTERTWGERVRAAFDAERQVLGHRRLPTTRAQAERAGERLFESLVTVNHFHVYAEAIQRGSFELAVVDEAWEETDFALVANFVRTPDGALRVDLAFDAEVCGERQTAATAELYRRVLAAMAGSAAAAIPGRTLLAAGEDLTIRTEWGSNDRPWPSEATIVDLVAERAAACPDDALALDYPDGRLTYRELMARADRWAQRLEAAGVRPGDRVATIVPASAELVTALLGILSVGAAYVPLDPDHPLNRQRLILADAAPAAIIVATMTTAAIASAASASATSASAAATASVVDRPETGVRGVVPVLTPESAADRVSSVIAAPSISDRRTSPEDPAYIVYTSGSTGRPKGVVVPHRAVVRLIHEPDYVRIESGDRVGQAATFGFDAAVFEVWGALAAGGTVVGVERSAVLDPDALATALADLRIDVMFLTTAVVHAVARRRPDAFKPLRTLLFGGETADPVAVRTVLDTAPPQRLVHVYGPTETAVFAVWHEITTVPRGAGSVPIGRPIANTEVLVVDRDGVPLPPGAPGELLIGGPGVALGYLGLPELTAERFVPHPVEADRGGYAAACRTVYRTGDIVRWDAEGRLEFVGRSDNQVKIRGFRVEPAEVEAVLAALPGVDDAVVLVRRGADGTAALVGYVSGTALDGGPLDETAVLAAAAAELPRPMVPSALIALAEFPLTANGKVDRAALPAPESVDRDRRHVEPENEDERRVAATWAQVLSVTKVGATDDFFEVGGHSLLLAQLAARLSADWGVRLPLETLNTHTTVRTQAAELRRLLRGETESRTVPGVVELRRGSADLPPLILIHPVGGTCAIYTSLARALPGDRTVLGLQAPGVDGDGEPLDTVEDLAAHHLATLRAAGIDGPLLLGGMSMGGTIAYELARRLDQLGERPAFVALLDSPGPGEMPRRFRDDAELLAAAFVAESEGMAEHLRTLSPDEMMRYVLAEARAGGAVPDDFELVDLGVFLRVWKAHTTALYGYVPKPYSGPVHYFRAQDTVAPHPANPERPWQSLLGSALRVIPVPGDHQSMVEPPHVATLATLVADAIRHDHGHDPHPLTESEHGATR